MGNSQAVLEGTVESIKEPTKTPEECGQMNIFQAQLEMEV